MKMEFVQIIMEIITVVIVIYKSLEQMFLAKDLNLKLSIVVVIMKILVTMNKMS